MNQAQIRFPVICPACDAEALASYPLKDIVDVLLNFKPLFLESRCHRVVWQASSIEIEQIHDYVSVAILHRNLIHRDFPKCSNELERAIQVKRSVAPVR